MEPSLLLETSSRRPSILLRQQGTCIELEYPGKSTLTAFLSQGPKRLFQYHGIEPASVRLIGIGLGPGSYTGLRCGMAYAKALAAMADSPVVLGMSSLLAWALQCSGDLGIEGRLIMTADAHQGDLYCRAETIKEGSPDGKGRDEVLAVEDFPERAIAECEQTSLPVTVFGFGCGILQSACVPEKATCIPNAGVPSARGLLLLLDAAGPEPFRTDADRLEPAYLRPSAAEMKKRNT